MAKKKRTHIPKAVEELVMKEFNHRCAICGEHGPHIHHIDEDPSNNAIDNLLPLCPNHHLRDQHNPTIAIDRGKLSLFRQFKDPAILHPKFNPIWTRCRFMENVNEMQRLEIENAKHQLVDFIKCLKFGEFYARQIESQRIQNQRISFESMRGLPEWGKMREQVRILTSLRESVGASRIAVLELIVEILRYQDWLPDNFGKSHARI